MSTSTPSVAASVGGALLALTLAATLVAPGPAAADQNEAPAVNPAYASLSAGGGHSCVRDDAGSVRCWGDNDSGQLGQGDTARRGDAPGEMGAALATIDLGPGRTARAVAAGGAHTCAILDNGRVKCWGDNDTGQLGLGGDEDDHRGDAPGEMGAALPAVDLGPGRTATAITAGGNHTCAILDNGRVKCWGGNGVGRLGLGDTLDRGDGPGEMGAALPAVDLGPGRTATAVAAGLGHTCALLDNRRVKCWGDNSSGQLGLGDTNPRGDGPGEMGAALPAVDLGPGRTATAVTVLNSASCALLDNRRVKCWGGNTSGQLGLGDTAARGDGPGEMGAALAAVDLGPGRTALAVAGGAAHVCVRRDDRRAVCWGNNGTGRLGIGDTLPRGDGPGEMGAALPPVDLGPGRTALAVTPGTRHSCALLDTRRIRCWGENVLGQLGLGDTTSRGQAPGQMGTDLPVVGVTVVACGGRTVTVDRSRGETPTTGDDVIVGLDGAETIDALAGNDRVCGRGGNDTLIGGPGSDIVDGGPGNDDLRGGSGTDTCHGRGGSDSASGCEVRTGVP